MPTVINTFGYSLSLRLAKHVSTLMLVASLGLAAAVTAIVASWVSGWFSAVVLAVMGCGMLSVTALLLRGLYVVSGKPDGGWSTRKRAAVACLALGISLLAVLTVAWCGMALLSQTAGT